MKYQNFGAGDYQLMKEEYLQECVPSDLGYAMNKTTIRREPAIVLRQKLENKNDLRFRDIESKWTIAQEAGVVEILFLDIDFKATQGKPSDHIRIAINNFSDEVLDWFRLLISTGGILALNDSIGDVEAISVSGPLDVPRDLLAVVEVA